LKKNTSRQIRLAFLLHAWNSTLDYSTNVLREAEQIEKMFGVGLSLFTFCISITKNASCTVFRFPYVFNCFYRIFFCQSKIFFVNPKIWSWMRITIVKPKRLYNRSMLMLL